MKPFSCLIVFIISSLIIPKKSTANNLWVDSIRISPTTITKNDSVQIRLYTETTTKGYQAYINYTLTPGNIWITGCYKISLATGNSYFADTFNVGKLAEGQYKVNFLGYVSTDSQCTNIIDSVTVVDTLIVHAPESIGTVGESDISVYPNPASHYVTISLPRGLRIEQVVLQGLNGRILKQTNNHLLSVAELPQGIYFLQVVTNNGKFYQKFRKD